MGQRSQIYIHFNVNENEGMVARYFQWNYGERMVSRARHLMEILKDEYLEHKYLFGNEREILKLNRLCDVNFDMRDIVLSTDILQECKEYFGTIDIEDVFGYDNNDGQLLIAVTDNGIKYSFIDYYTEAKPMSAEEYMKWNTSKENWHEPDEYMDDETIAYTEKNIDYINSVAELMTEKEIENFIYRDCGKILQNIENSGAEAEEETLSEIPEMPLEEEGMEL